ncbi:hypothetical protein [Kouleothrix sp.]|uniref:hypothetical protein n=1 Tax=Kouleothrix sp. TaxID=2779161 RepID=UPI00391A077F
MAPKSTEPPREPPAPRAIDVRQLAERVYQLMLADLRLELARGAAPRRKER